MSTTQKFWMKRIKYLWKTRSLNLNHLNTASFSNRTTYLVVMHKHITQPFNATVFNRLRFWLLRVAVVGSEPDFRRVLQSKLKCHPFYHIIICMLLGSAGMQSSWKPPQKMITHMMVLILGFDMVWLHPQMRLNTELLIILTAPSRIHLLWASPTAGNAQPSETICIQSVILSTIIPRSWVPILKTLESSVQTRLPEEQMTR